MPEIGFIIFWFFFLFFSEFPCAGQVWTESGTKIFFFLFLGQSYPVLAKNNARKWFFNFLNFFAIFLRNFLPRAKYERRTKIFFLSFSAYLLPFWLKIMPERDFLIFWFFLLLFWNFLARVGHEQNSGIKFFSTFLGLSLPVLPKNNAGKRFFLIFWIFLLFF